MSSGWQVLHAAVVVLTREGRLKGAILRRPDGKFVAHSVEGRLGAFNASADAVAAITGHNLEGELANARR
jgi:hypothetical protein